jgi:hypothetical protein
MVGPDRSAHLCSVVGRLSSGALLGESRLLMPPDEISCNKAPVRNATVVADGHAVVLEVSTAEARECFTKEHMDHIRKVSKLRANVNACQVGASGGAGVSTDPVEEVALAAKQKVRMPAPLGKAHLAF